MTIDAYAYKLTYMEPVEKSTPLNRVKQLKFNKWAALGVVGALAVIGIVVVALSLANTAPPCTPNNNCAATTLNGFGGVVTDPNALSVIKETGTQPIIDVTLNVYDPATKFNCALVPNPVSGADPKTKNHNRDFGLCPTSAAGQPMPVKSATLWVRSGGYLAQDGSSTKYYENHDSPYYLVGQASVDTANPRKIVFQDIDTTAFPALTNSCADDFDGRYTLTAVLNTEISGQLPGQVISRPFWRIGDDHQININSSLDGAKPGCVNSEIATYQVDAPAVESLTKVLITPKEGRLAQVRSWLQDKGVEKGVFSAIYNTLSVDALPNLNSLDPTKTPSRILVEQARANPDVDTAAVSISGHQLDIGTSDPDFGNQHYLQNTNISNYYQPFRVRDERPSAWDYTMGHSSVTIAVMDSGLYRNVPNDEFSGQLDGDGWDFTKEPAGPYDGPPPPSMLNTSDKSDNIHGTQVAGIVSAAMNGKGITGVCPKCKLKPVKYNGDGGGGPETLDSYVRAMNYIYHNPGNIKVVNMSNDFALSGSQKDVESVAKMICEPISKLIADRGIVVITSASQAQPGGSGQRNLKDNTFPQNCPGIGYLRGGMPWPITVTSRSHKSDRRSKFADGNYDYGAGDWFMRVPGEKMPNVINGEFELNGTSFAAPQVAGAAGLLYSRMITHGCGYKCNTTLDKWYTVMHALLQSSRDGSRKNSDDPGAYRSGYNRTDGAHLDGGRAMYIMRLNEYYHPGP